MAIIGSLVIGMSANTSALTKALTGSSGLINQFGASMKLAGGGLGMLARDTVKFASGVGQDIASLARISGVTKAVSFAGRAMIGLRGLAVGAFHGIGSVVSATAARVNAFGNDIYKIGGQLRLPLIAAAAAGTAAIYKLVKSGSNLVENQNMIKASFGASADYVINASKQMAAAGASTNQEFLVAAGMLGGIFKNMGYGVDDAAKLSVEMNKLAIDMASFKNISVEDALQKITSGLTGEVRGLKELGINLLENVITQEAYREKIAKTGEALTEQQKVEARLSSLMKQTKDMQGDWARTADDVANATKSVTGQFSTLMETLGEQLQPIAKSVLSDISAGIGVISQMWMGSQTAVLDATGTTVGGAQQQSSSIGFIQNAVGKVADAWQMVGLTWSYLESEISSGLARLMGLLEKFAQGFAAIARAITGANIQSSGFFGAWEQDLKRLSKEQMKAFDMKATAPAFSEGINKAFDDARNKIAAARADLLKSHVDVTKLKPVPEAKLGGKAEKQTNTAASFGSAEAANTILKSQFGGDQTAKDNKKIADNTKTANVHLANIARAVQGVAGQGGALDWDSI